MYSNIDNGNFVLSIFLDFRKAFDSVSHDILLGKLSHYGFRGVALNWIKSYLSERKQMTVVGDANSSMKRLTHGVPQGSILGPLFFLIFINDLPNSSSFFSYVLFADDSTLSTTFSEANSVATFRTINAELMNVSKWLRANKISINLNKTKCIAFSYRKSIDIPQVCMDGSEITRTDCVKFLGLYLDQHLTFKQHINHVSEKVSKSLGILSKLRYFLPHATLKMLYQSLIHPYLSYGVEAWGSAYHNVINKVLILQKKAIRAINSLPYNDNTNEYFKQNNILKLEDNTVTK